jgi:hypothetical protein
MIFNDERAIYCDEQEEISIKFENKSRDEIYDMLEDYDKILILSGDVKYKWYERFGQVLTIPLIPILLLLVGVKWMVTGDQYLNSWCKKSGIERVLRRYFI